MIEINILQIEHNQKLKNEGKRLRDSKDVVMEKLFAAFEKHQYYNVKDLVRVTNQPIVSLIIKTPVIKVFRGMYEAVSLSV